MKNSLFQIKNIKKKNWNENENPESEVGKKIVREC